MDGITTKAREDGIKTAAAAYSKAVETLRDDPKMPIAQKQQLVKALTRTMWEDPRTDYGETRQHLENAMQTLAFGENTMNLGSGYASALDAIATGRVTSARQILQMENDGLLTAKGYSNLMARFSTLDKPNKEQDTRRDALAINHIKSIIMKDLDENSPIPGMKPGPKQYDMLDKTIQAYMDALDEAGDDRTARRKVTSLEAVKELVDQVYPWDQRHADRISLGQQTQPSGLVIPPTVQSDSRSQQAYKNIVAYPPMVKDKDGKEKQVSTEGWQARDRSPAERPAP
jgi:hypothetical protein